MSIIVTDLTYTYPGRTEPALRKVSLAFQAGELTLIAGASGCGKTTLVRCINGLIPASYASGALEGQVRLFGQNTAGLPLARLSQIVGTVLQDPERQIVASQVIQEIAFGLENLGLPRQDIRQRIREVAQFLKIEELLERDTHRLSGGEKQKVALAGVLAMRPRALLLDEPLASLDPASGHEALALLRQLADDGIAVVVIEHRVEDVLAVRPEHCVYLRDGQVAYDGDSAGLAQTVDWREIKLPAPVIIQRARKEIGDWRLETGDSAARGPSPISNLQSPISNLSSPPLIEFRGVSFRYDDGPEVLREVSLAIQPGDVVAVLGPNGAGKTTLAKHAIGLNRPTAGQVLIDGRDSRALSVAGMSRTVGYVFQSPSHMLFAPTVREELAFGPRNLGLDDAAIARHTASALETVNLAAMIDRSPLSLSFGQQKRIGIAAVLAMNPRVLVMDEPTAGQDYASTMRFMGDILRRDPQGRREAVLFITHDLDLAITCANRILLVAEGRLAADGPPEQVLAQPDLLERCRIRPTSLLEANLEWLPVTGHFVSAAALARHPAVSNR
jgi:energy-coupling factor transport system ATP-binding protein